jgi:mycothiol system anti-sigma-R factor
MDCREFQKFVHLFLDGEFDERDRGEVEGHLRECPQCLQQARFEKWFREGVRRCLAHEEASPELRRRILTELERMQPAAPRPRILAVAAPAAAVLLVGVLLGYIWSLTGFVPFGDDPAEVPVAPRATADPPPAAAVALPPAAGQPARAGAPAGALAGPVRASALASAAAAVEPARRSPHPRKAPRRRAAPTVVAEEEPAEEPENRGEQELPIELRSSDPDEVAAYLRERLARPIVVPTFQGRLKLVGATASPEDDSAQLVYRHGKQHLTLRVSARPDRSLPAQGIVVRQVGAHPTAMWRRSGFTFSVTSLLDPGDVVRLVAGELHAQQEQEARALARRRLEQAPPAWIVPDPSYSSEAQPVSSTPR